MELNFVKNVEQLHMTIRTLFTYTTINAAPLYLVESALISDLMHGKTIRTPLGNNGKNKS